MSLAACLIVRDGAATVETTIRSVRPFVDEVCIYLAGTSSDGTPELLERIAGEPGAPLRVVQGVWNGDYAEARTRSFEMASPDVEWLIWIDADDKLHGGENLATIASDAESAEALYAVVLYVSEGDLFQWPSRIVRAEAGYWEGAVHEEYRLDPSARRFDVEPATLYVEHLQVGGPQDKYLAALQLATRDVARNPRAYFLLGRTLHYMGRHTAAVRALDVYLTAKHDAIEGRWNDHRAAALLLSMRSHEAAGRRRIADKRSAEGRRYVAQWESAFERGETPDHPLWRTPRETAAREWWNARLDGGGE